MRLAQHCAVLAGALFLGACGSGLIYTHTVEPLDLNLDETPVLAGPQHEGESNVKTFRYYVRIDWDSNAIGEIAKEHGFERVYYADLETLSILGIWTQRFVHVYGEQAGGTTASETPGS